MPGRWVVRALALVSCLASCSNPAAKPDPCAMGELIRVVDGSYTASALDSDAVGYVVFWSRADLPYLPTTYSLWATRPGGTAVRLVGSVQMIDAIATASAAAGWLVCAGDQCIVVGPDLGVLATSSRVPARVVAAGRTSDGLVIVGDQMVRVDETGGPVGSTVPAPCTGVVFTDAGLACLLQSVPGCGLPIPDGPTECLATLHVFRADASTVLDVPDISPGPAKNEPPFLPRLAAVGDGWLISWVQYEAWHGRLVSAAGAVEALPDVPASGNSNDDTGLAEVPGGAIATLVEHANGDSTIPVTFFISADGHVGTPARLVDPGGELTQNVTGARLRSASHGSGYALIWNGRTADQQDHLAFRAMGCPR
jgi:hypothetical protein